jgi:Heparinase II/III-like protein/Heparinase II/III N-terminus
MSWDEFRTRVSQEAGKRLDVIRYSAGMAPVSEAPKNSGVSPGKFFFSSQELTERVLLLKQHLPLEVQGIIVGADKICRHRFKLLGYDDLDYGENKEIDWHLDAVHGKRTALIPWFKIDFLDPDVAGDHKVTWELNRHQHLVTLAKSWLLTGQERYAGEAIAQWYSWQNANPYPLGVNWASSLEIAFRALSWLWLQHLLAGYPTLPAKFAADIRRALALSGRHIERYLSTYFSPNTHLLGEAVALFFIGTLCPQLSEAERWKNLGWTIIQQEARRQVRPDGVYFEQSLYYHVYALDFFLYARLLAERNGIGVASDYDPVLRRMLEVVEAVAQVGPPDSFGDDDGGRLFNPRRNRAQHLTDPLAVGSALFHDASLQANTEFTEEAIWLFGANALRGSHNRGGGIRKPRSKALPDGGLYVSASAEPFPQQLIIDAGPQGTGRSGHGHADALSVKLSFNNLPWLIDSGTFVYITPQAERYAFRGTRAHNTLAVDGLDQAEPAGPFAWDALPITKAESWIPAANFMYFAGSHSGYERLAQPIRHRRFIFNLPGCFLLVRDVAEGAGTHLLETNWHFAPEITVTRDHPSTDRNIFVASTPGGSDYLTLLPVSDPQWKCELEDGFVSPVYGAKVPAQTLRCSAKITTPAEHAMLLIPASRKDSSAGRLLRTQSSGPRPPAAVYKYEDFGLSHCMIFGRTPATWTFGPWESDAVFLYASIANQNITYLVCCEATFLHLHGEPVFSGNAKLQYLEWDNREGKRQMRSSDEAIANSISNQLIDRTLFI